LGLTAGVDTIALLRRKGEVYTLHVEGRDLEREISKVVRFDRETCCWEVTGEASEVERTEQQNRILRVLVDGAVCTVVEIMRQAGLPQRNATDQLLWRMVSAGLIERVGRGKYQIAIRVE
jgi:hypothetical protein